MARRASSGLNPGIILAAVVVIGAVVYGGLQLLRDDGVAFEGIPRLRIEEFLENGNALRTNVYVVEGEIDEKLRFSGGGQLVSVRVDGPHGHELIGIVIPAKFNKSNIDTKQGYAFKVEFKKRGVAVATDMKRL